MTTACQDQTATVESATPASALLAVADPAMVGELAHALHEVGLFSLLAFDTDQVLARLQNRPFDDIAVALIDVRLAPDAVDDLVAAVRTQTRAPILVLRGADSGVNDDADAQLPLTAAAGLVATRAHELAHSRDRSTIRPVLQWGELHLDPATHEVGVGATPLILTSAQFRILALLVGAQGAVVGTGELALAIYGRSHCLDSQRVRAHIVRLRRQLRDARPDQPDLVVTVRAAGYRLGPPWPAAAPADTPTAAPTPPVPASRSTHLRPAGRTGAVDGTVAHTVHDAAHDGVDDTGALR